MPNVLAGRLIKALKNAVSGEQKPTTDIKFGVHNHYNNNSDSIGDFKHPSYFCLIGEIPVRVTDQGLVVFNLGKRLDIQEKVVLAIALDDLLKQKFNVGLSFATCGLSDCVSENELQPYYNAMKGINPNMITVYTDVKFPSDDELKAPQGVTVDHIVDKWAHNPDTATIIAGIVNPNGEGKTEPQEGWQAFERTLENLFERAEELAPKLLSSSPINLASHSWVGPK